MKKVIALYGAGNRGKSTTLKMVYRSLETSFEVLSKENVRPDKHGTYRLNERYDVRVIFIVNGARVGLESQGDPNSRLEDSLKFFRDNMCRLIVCPTRTWGGTVDCVNRMKPEFEIEWIKKSVADDESSEPAYNKKDASMILKLIREFTLD
jgi:hypothetical protein